MPRIFPRTECRAEEAAASAQRRERRRRNSGDKFIFIDFRE
jgi:hypothetical protein